MKRDSLIAPSTLQFEQLRWLNLPKKKEEHLVYREFKEAFGLKFYKIRPKLWAQFYPGFITSFPSSFLSYFL